MQQEFVIQKAIIKTMAYADVFDYPLTLPEIWKYLISSKEISQNEIEREVENLTEVGGEKGYYFLKGREKIVSIRQQREKWSRGKLKIAYKAAGILKIIPTIKLVALTGALAMNNANKEDDIDLLIVTAKNRLWLTRGLVVVLLRLIGLYRRPNKIRDMICPNMFLAEDNLKVPKKEQNLFTAHEVVQLKPLWVKNNIYGKFLGQNLWLKKYLANWKN